MLLKSTASSQAWSHPGAAHPLENRVRGQGREPEQENVANRALSRRRRTFVEPQQGAASAAR